MGGNGHLGLGKIYHLVEASIGKDGQWGSATSSALENSVRRIRSWLYQTGQIGPPNSNRRIRRTGEIGPGEFGALVLCE